MTKLIERVFCKGKLPEACFQWKQIDVKSADPSGRVSYQNYGIEVPANWSDNAAVTFASKYMFRGVEDQVLRTKVPTELAVAGKDPRASAGEWSLKQVAWRMTRFWRVWGEANGYFKNETEAQYFEEECRYAIYAQIFHPNSPQWFNTGISLYEIRGSADGNWAHDTNASIEPAIKNDWFGYDRPAVHACHLMGIEDKMFGENSLTEGWVTEARLFKYGSGVGTNWSNIRGKGEPLSTGGVSSGLMSFLKPPNAIAGVIKSGGTTRRAAKLVSVDIDHPDIEAFIQWKTQEERAALALIDHGYSMAWNEEGSAYDRVGGQNSNNSIGIPAAFHECRAKHLPWYLISRVQVSKKHLEQFVLGNSVAHPQGTVLEIAGPKMKFGAHSINKLINCEGRKGNGWYAVIAERSPDALLTLIAKCAWQSADPGVHHLDHFETWNPVREDGPVRTANPCSEYLFLENTSCNLCCLNLRKFGVIDAEFDQAVRLMTFILDITVTFGSLPSKSLAEGAFSYRTLGLGYAGLGANLMAQGVAYDSDEGRACAAVYTAALTLGAWKTSAELAARLQPFPRYTANRMHIDSVLEMHARAADKMDFEEEAAQFRELIGKPVRNAFVSLVMPAGTVGITLDAETTGIEPFFALETYKALASGGGMMIPCPAVEPALRSLNYSPADVMAALEWVAHRKTIADWPRLKAEHKGVFATAVSPDSNYLTWQAHVKMIAAVQPFISGAVSKTINMPEDSQIADIKAAYELAHKLGVKCVALYRDGCKMSQPMNMVDKSAQEDSYNKTLLKAAESLLEAGIDDPGLRQMIDRRSGALQPKNIAELMHRKPAEFWELLKENWGGIELPSERLAYTTEIVIHSKLGNKKFYLTVGVTPDNEPIEVFIRAGIGGRFEDAVIDVTAMSLSWLLQMGRPLKRLCKRFLSNPMDFEPMGMASPSELRFCHNFIEAILKVMALKHLSPEDLEELGLGNRIEKPKELKHQQTAESTAGTKPCSNCGKPVKAWGCDPCPYCGHKEGGCGG